MSKKAKKALTVAVLYYTQHAMPISTEHHCLYNNKIFSQRKKKFTCLNSGIQGWHLDDISDLHLTIQ